MREAIGVQIADYLVKPVHPRQILSVVTRLLEGDRIRQQRLSRDFVTRFRELEGAAARHSAGANGSSWSPSWRAGTSGCRSAGEPGLLEALQHAAGRACARTSRPSSQNSTRAGWRTPKATGRRSRWTWAPSSSYRCSKPTGAALLMVIDCLRLDQWDMLRDADRRRCSTIEESHYFSILPTATPYSRNAIFSGLFPMEIARAPSGVVGERVRRREPERARGRAAHRAAAGARGRAGAGALRETLHRRRRRRSAASPAGAPGAGRRHGAGLQLHRPADARPLRERDPVRGGARRTRRCAA